VLEAGSEPLIAGGVTKPLLVLLRRPTALAHKETMIGNLLGDGGSPLYIPDRPGELRHELRAVLLALEGRDQDASI
jgi:hypothetical protein